jgi:hypothetical protein
MGLLWSEEKLNIKGLKLEIYKKNIGKFSDKKLT